MPDAPKAILSAKQEIVRDQIWRLVWSELNALSPPRSLEKYLMDIRNGSVDILSGVQFAISFFNLSAVQERHDFTVSLLRRLQNNEPAINVYFELFKAADTYQRAIENFRHARSLKADCLPAHLALAVHDAEFYRTCGDPLLASMYERLELSLKSATSGKLDPSLSDKFKCAVGYPGSEYSSTDWVVFLTHSASIRINKLCNAAHRAGLKVCFVAPLKSWIDAEDLSPFDRVVRYESAKELWLFLSSFPTMAVHSFMTAEDGAFDALLAFVCQPQKFVFDVYDIQDPNISAMERAKQISFVYDKYLVSHRIQRFLIDQCHKICTRSLYSRALRTRHVGLHQVRLFLPEGPNGRTDSAAKLNRSDDKLHVVHGGSFLTEKSGGSPWSSLYWLADKAAEFDIHFHLYPMPWVYQDMEDYELLAARSGNFHLYDPLPFVEWIEEISQYDIGMFYVHPNDESTLAATPRAVDPSGAWSNKIGDYIDAGLYTVISRKYKFMSWLVTRYGVGEGVSLDQVLEKRYWDELKVRVVNGKIDYSAIREKFNPDAQGKVLAKFYKNRMPAEKR